MPYLIFYFPTLHQWNEAVPNVQVLNRENINIVNICIYAEKNQANTVQYRFKEVV